MKKIRVLFLSKPYVAASYRQKFQLMAADPRFEIGLVVPHNWAGQDFEPDARDNYWIRRLPLLFNGHNHLHLYRGLTAAFDEFAPDVFNIEEEHYSLVTAQALSLAKKRGVPCTFYTWQNIHKNYPLPFSWIEQLVFRSCPLAIAGNQEALDILRKKGFQKRAYILPQMGADTATLAKIPSETRAEVFGPDSGLENAFIVAFAGRLVEEKGIQDLIQALPSLLDLPIHLVILGSGPYQEALKQAADRLDVGARVHFLGSKKSTDVYRYLRQIDVLALPSHTKSNWKEQFGRILVEAMLSGAVVLGSDSGEIPRVIRGGGLVFPEGNVSILAQRLRTLCENPRLTQKLAAKGRRRAQSHFTNEVIAARTLDAMLELYQQRPEARLSAGPQFG
ncbi:MAG TPA: glycosyltransferase family 4 protein [Oligoflexus sp.]|uniref:glycosyltransferase family 4 protein n=1 Tax=Oligoflexus sp. TaxID=1971216 RepID=UPI002D7EBA8F|nr:glycosyltransferase family 4 protein [Oligoflexus sp.]HET9238528.1 glycosyltransferase family 4 protein [Oligoflexus sp.]